MAISCFVYNEDGILLLEANRMLRAGGYFVWAAQPVYKHEDNLQEQWKGSQSCQLKEQLQLFFQIQELMLWSSIICVVILALVCYLSLL